MRFLRSADASSGQILLIVVLAAVISLTVGLSVAARVVTNTKTTTDEVNAQQALSAAESGVEQSLKTSGNVGSAGSPVSFGNNSKVYSVATSVNNSQFLINGGNLISRDDGADIWLSDHGPLNSKPTYVNPKSTTMRVYWKDNDSTTCANNPAIELIILSGSSSSPTLTRKVYDTCANRTAGTLDSYSGNGAVKTISTISFDHYAQVDVNTGLLARAIPLYANTKLAVELYAYQNVPTALSPAPSQGYLIQATGTAGGTAANPNVTRTLRVFQGYPKLPSELFPYTLFIP